MDGMFVKNPFATRRNADGTAIVTAEVPPARVFTIDVSDDKQIGEEISVSDGNNSDAGNVGVISPIDSNVSHSSLQSYDYGNVGKSETDGKHSESPHNDNSTHSDSTPSSYAEADGSQNEGKGNEHSSSQQGRLSPQPDGIPSEGNGDYCQKSDGYNHTNG